MNFALALSTSLIVPCGRVMCMFLMPLQYDQDYHPGRRKRGKDYKEGMVKIGGEFSLFILIWFMEES